MTVTTAADALEEVSRRGRIACFIPALSGGGAQRAAVNILRGVVRLGLKADLVLAEAGGPYLGQVPAEVRIIDLRVSRALEAVAPLSKYLRRERPFVLLSHMSYVNLIAVMAKRLSGSKTRLVLVEQTTMSAVKSRLWRDHFTPAFAKRLYPRADAVVGVSEGVARDLERKLGLASGRVKVIHNPVVDELLFAKAEAPPEHPWLWEKSSPVFLAVGRLTPEKDLFTLIKAFALLRKRKEARLLILGEGESRRDLERLADGLRVADDISMPGFVENPYSYMSRASAFVLSSRREGLPFALIEAMACRCPVVATDCPSGPSEILEMGRYGALVPVGDAAALADAMWRVTEAPSDGEALVRRAKDFSIDKVVGEYVELFSHM